MATYDVSDYFDDGAITLQGIRSSKHPDGKAYTFPSPSGKVGLRLVAILNVGGKANAGLPLTDEDRAGLLMGDDEEHDLYKQVMGSALQEMLDDGVTWENIQRTFKLLFAKHALGQDIGVGLVNLGKAQPPPNRAARRTAKKTAGRKSGRASTGATGSVRATASPTSRSSTSPTASEETAKAV